MFVKKQKDQWRCPMFSRVAYRLFTHQARRYASTVGEDSILAAARARNIHPDVIRKELEHASFNPAVKTGTGKAEPINKPY